MKRECFQPVCNGFTLLELLVATAIFAVLSALAYGGLQSVLTAREDTERQAVRLAELQTFITMFERDLEQIVVRPVRDEYGNVLPTFRADMESGGLEFTRSGWANPAEQARSSLQRVAYGLNEDGIARFSWRVLDRAQDSEAHATYFLPGVKAWQVRFLDRQRNWSESWPPQQSGADISWNSSALPVVVELTLELTDWGRIQRLVRLPGSGI